MVPSRGPRSRSWARTAPGSPPCCARSSACCPRGRRARRPWCTSGRRAGPPRLRRPVPRLGVRPAAPRRRRRPDGSLPRPRALRPDAIEGPRSRRPRRWRRWGSPDLARSPLSAASPGASSSASTSPRRSPAGRTSSSSTSRRRASTRAAASSTSRRSPRSSPAGPSIVTATHDISEAVEYDQVMLLARRVVALGPGRRGPDRRPAARHVRDPPAGSARGARPALRRRRSEPRPPPGRRRGTGRAVPAVVHGDVAAPRVPPGATRP